jgi:sucrose-phosphate synthase
LISLAVVHLIHPVVPHIAAQTSITTPLNAPDPLLISRFPRLYLVLISLHGLVRGEKMELGRDPDTGGQVK